MMTDKIILRILNPRKSNVLSIFVAAVLVAFMVVLLNVNMAGATAYTIPDAELMNGEFVREWGTSTLTGKTDVPGQGVQFTVSLTGAGDPKIGIGDAWPENAAANLAQDPVLSHDNSSLAAFDSIEMIVQYVSGPSNTDLNLHLFMNTGLTGGSGNPSDNWRNDTFWGGSWVAVSPGQTVTLRLDFNAAEAWNISDNPSPHTGGLGWTNGVFYSINDRDRNEVSNIGIEIADSDSDTLGQSVVLHLNAPVNVPEPGTLLLLGFGLIAVSVSVLSQVKG